MKYSASTAFIALCASIGTSAFAAEKSMVPYYLSGGYVGNGGDELTLVPEKDLNKDDAVVPLPPELLNFGFIQIDAPESSNSHEGMTSLTLTKCRGGSVSKHGTYIGKSGACTKDYTDETFQLNVELNQRTQIQPGLYQITTREEEGEKFETYPGIIRVVKGRTTVVPLPKIVLPEISRSVTASIYSDYSAPAMQQSYVAGQWLGKNRAEACTTMQRETYTTPRGLLGLGGHKRPLSFDDAAEAYCRNIRSSDWRNSFRYFEFKDGTSVYENYAFRSYRGEVRMTQNRGYSSNLGLQFASVTSGKSVTAFPGIYRLEFDSDYGAKTKTKGVNVGNFSPASINKVYPQ